MAKERKPSSLKSICPLCGGKSVLRNDNVLGFLAPKFNCPDCGAGLTAAPTPRSLLGLVVVFAALPAALALIRWMQATFELQGVLLTCIYGGVVSGLAACGFKLMFEGFAFKPWRIGGF